MTSEIFYDLFGMSPPRPPSDLGTKSDTAAEEGRQGSCEAMELTQGYVIEHHTSGALKKSVGAILVYTDHETANYFRKRGLKDPEEWSVVAVRINRKDPER